MRIKINHAKLQKDKTIIARMWRSYNHIKHEIFIYPVHRFKVKKWYRLINKIQMRGLTDNDKFTILSMRSCGHKVKCIKDSTGLPHKKIMAVLYYHGFTKISGINCLIGRIILE